MQKYSNSNNIFRSNVLASKNAIGYCVNIPAQFVELRPFSGPAGNAGIESLLEDVTETEIEEAISLVNGKVNKMQLHKYLI